MEASADGRFTETSMDIAGQPAFLAPEVVRCRRGCVTYSMAGEEYGSSEQTRHLVDVACCDEDRSTGSLGVGLRMLQLCFTDTMVLFQR